MKEHVPQFDGDDSNESRPEKSRVEPTLFECIYAFEGAKAEKVKTLREFEGASPKDSLVCEGEPITSILLKKGDILIMEGSHIPEGDETNYIFRVDQTRMHSYDISDSRPLVITTGRIEGASIGSDDETKSFTYYGSCFPGVRSMIEYMIQPGYMPNFYEEGDTRREKRLPMIMQDYGIMRDLGDGKKRMLYQYEIASSNPEAEARHEQRMATIQNLLHRFNLGRFRYTDTIDSVVPPEQSDVDRIDGQFSDQNYEVRYRMTKIHGNQLLILDKHNHHALVCVFFDNQGENTLQIGYSDLREGNAGERHLFEKAMSVVGLRWVKSGILTFTSSPVLGFDTASYIPSDQEAKSYLHIPKFQNHVFCPHIFWEKDKPLEVDTDVYPFTCYAEEHPQLADEVKVNIHLEKREGKNSVLHMGKCQKEIPSFENILTMMGLD